MQRFGGIAVAAALIGAVACNRAPEPRRYEVRGQILVVPAGTPHKFENLGPGPLETVDIHGNGKFITEWLE